MLNQEQEAEKPVEEEKKDDRPMVVITGVHSYHGALTCREFIRDGGFRVKGTLRSMDHEAKITPIKEAFDDEDFDKLILKECDVEKPEDLKKVFKDA